ncbi:dimethylarginine dimethylaminohydrolase [Agromyces sp. CFH 90414]|uniref:Dimethylarginine dimethylaminohydrolase n=1 Tax=Agromyces agglutinans TaxID=2662258 RepID=A0A6I2FKA4_9MICO|nr:dimethylargininase [Agromyces agglutinans]MRG61098.1 dimethylarginine dimethylaminohydrolase [Agromyces agglutinans]
MTSPAPSAQPARARFRPATSPGRRAGAAMLSAAAVAFTGFAVATLALFVGNGQSPDVFGQVAGHFFASAVIAWALLSVANAVGATRRWFLGLLAGFASAVLAALLGTSWTVLVGGRGFAPDLFLFVLGSLVSLNLVFIITVTLAEVFLAPVVQRGVLGFVPSRAPRRLALVRIPASNLAEGELTHLDRVPIDQALADDQWDNYCAALVAEGWETIEVDAAPDLADSVFVEDAVVMFGDLAVLTSPGAESRRAEVEAVERAIAGVPGITIARIQQPGTLDGGDVLKVGDLVYVGASSRTNAEGIRQLRAILAPHGFTVVAVPVTRALHLKSSATALPDGTVIGHPDLVDEPALFTRFLAVPEPEGVAVVALSDETLLMSAAAPKTAAMLAGFGYRVVTVDISEFEKLEGCVTCLSVRVR